MSYNCTEHKLYFLCEFFLLKILMGWHTGASPETFVNVRICSLCSVTIPILLTPKFYFMNTNKKSRNLRKAGLNKQLAKKELKLFLEEFLEWMTPELAEDMLEEMLIMSMSSSESESLTSSEKANYVVFQSDISYLFYLVRDCYESGVFDEKLEKAAI